MKLSDDSRALLGILLRTYPWARWVSRSRGGGAKLRESCPMPNEYGGFTSEGSWEELPPGLLPEITEGTAVEVETLMKEGKE